LEDFDTDKYCSKCKANLSAASNFCPLCGWPKNRRMVPYEVDEEKVANDIESNLSTKEPTGSEFKNKIHRPTGVRLLGIFYMIIGVLIVAIAILFGLAVTLLVVGSAMSSLGGIGDMGDMPIPFEMNGIDSTMMPYLDRISGLPGMESLPSTSDIEELTSSAGVTNMGEVMSVLMETFVIVVLEFILGIIAFVIGRGLLRGEKWARIMAIASSIISIPLAALYVGKIDDLILLGSFAFDGMIIYYLLRPRVREYFDQTSIKNSIKNSKIKT